MAEGRTYYISVGEAKERKHLKDSARRFYEFTVLRNSLHDLHHHVLEAITLFERFFADYEGNLLRFAIETRLKSIDEYGSDNKSNWYRNNEADESEA